MVVVNKKDTVVPRLRIFIPSHKYIFIGLIQKSNLSVVIYCLIFMKMLALSMLGSPLSKEVTNSLD